MADSLTIPAPDAPNEEWGRLAVAIPGWRWMPGMAIGGEVSPRHRRVGDQWNMRCAMLDPRREHAWPDPDDPATEGCFARLAGRMMVIQVQDGFGVGLWNGEVWRMDIRLTQRTMGRAFIAAAADIGRWPGGAP